MSEFARRSLANRSSRSGARKLGFEACEPRALLSAVAVTSSADDGPGSFRAAVEAANGDAAISAIVFDARLSTVQLEETVSYTGSQALRIDGKVVNIQPVDSKQGDFDLFVASGGADLTLSQLTFRDGANGVVVDVPLDATGDVAVKLDRVTIKDNDYSVCTLSTSRRCRLRPRTRTPIRPRSAPTPSVTFAVLTTATSSGNGTAAHDQDGIRVDERGAGGISVQIANSQLNGNGAEGIELDEGGLGGVNLNVLNSNFNANGFISSGDPEDPDFDDGIDIDEADAGSVTATLVNVTASGNFDEGIDLNEGDDGDLNMLLVNVQANHNTDEGIALEEAGEGGIRAVLITVRARHNGADGVQFEEFDGGDLAVDIALSQIEDNGGFGIFASQAAPGSGSIRLRAVRLARNADGPFNTTIENEETGEEEDSGVVVLGH